MNRRTFFFTRFLDLWLRMRENGGVYCETLYSLTIESKENHLSFFFLFYKRLPIYRINILKCTSLRNLYSKLSTSHQILKFNRRLQIIETQRFQFIISKRKEKKRRGGKGGRKGKNASRRRFFQMKLITSCNGVLSPVIEWIPTYIIETMLLRDEGPN